MTLEAYSKTKQIVTPDPFEVNPVNVPGIAQSSFDPQLSIRENIDNAIDWLVDKYGSTPADQQTETALKARQKKKEQLYLLGSAGFVILAAIIAKKYM